MKNRTIQIDASSMVNAAGKLVFRVSVKEGDTLMEKTISAEDFVELLSSSTKEEGTLMPIPKLPAQVVSAKQDVNNASSYDVVIVYPAAKRAFSFVNQHFLLPFPALCCKASVRNGVRKNVKIFSLPTDHPTPDTLLTKYPFGNGGNADGKCCYGNIVVDGLSNIENCCNILDAFLAGKTNGDLYHNNVKGFTSQGKFVEFLMDKEVFPKDLLVATGKTFGELLK